MNELRPKLFDVMKGYSKAQLIKDIIAGIIVAIIALRDAYNNTARTHASCRTHPYDNTCRCSACCCCKYG